MNCAHEVSHDKYCFDCAVQGKHDKHEDFSPIDMRSGVKLVSVAGYWLILSHLGYLLADGSTFSRDVPADLEQYLKFHTITQAFRYCDTIGIPKKALMVTV